MKGNIFDIKTLVQKNVQKGVAGTDTIFEDNAPTKEWFYADQAPC